MDDIPGKILDNRLIIDGYHRLTIGLDRPLGGVTPGQFIMLRVPDREIFLRRPFSIYDSRASKVTIMYRVVGKGTESLAAAPKKASVMVLGPLGHGFTVSKDRTPLVIAGGIGFAGVRMLLRHLSDRAEFFLGVNGKAELAIADDLTDLSGMVSTLDGSAGFTGTVVDLLARHLPEYRGKDPEVFACGPLGMVKSLKALLEPEHIPCQVSVEERMACGMGLCFGCVCETKDSVNPYKRVCKEGPVFDLWDLSL